MRVAAALRESSGSRATNSRSEKERGSAAFGLITANRRLSFRFLDLSRFIGHGRSGFHTDVLLLPFPPGKKNLSGRQDLPHDPREILDTVRFWEQSPEPVSEVVRHHRVRGIPA